MRPDDQLTWLARDGALLVETASDAGWDAPVPGLTWDVRTVVIHTGAVHRWATDVIRRALPTNETGGSRAFWPADRSAEALTGWYVEGLELLIDALRDAPVDLACYTMLDDVSARDFWIRRQMLETAIHRGDVQAAAGSAPAVTGDLPPELSQVGLTELIGGFACTPTFAAARDGALVLQASDGPSWEITFSLAGNRAATGPEYGGGSGGMRVDGARVSGTSAQLYLWAWHRPSTVYVDGDPAVIELWQRVAI